MERRIQKILSLLLAFVMVIGMIPGSVFATETTEEPSAEYAAKIAETGEQYATLAEAVAAANQAEGPNTLELLKDIDFDAASALTVTGDLTITGEQIISRGAYTGTMFTVNAGVTLTLDGGIVLDGSNDWTFDSENYYADMAAGLTVPANSAEAHALVYTFSEDGGTEATAAMIAIKGNVVMNNATVRNCWGSTVFSVPAGATLTTNEGSVINHIRTTVGGSIVGQIKGTWTMNGGLIDDVFGRNTNGGLADIRDSGVININGGEITDVKTLGLYNNGNGILFQVYGESSKLNISGGYIHDNASFSPGGGWGSQVYLNRGGDFTMTGGVIEVTTTDHCSAFVANAPTYIELMDGTMKIDASLAARFDTLIYGDVQVGENMEIIGVETDADEAFFCLLGDANYTLNIDGKISGGEMWLMYNQPVTGDGTITSDVLIEADPDYFEHNGKVIIADANWLDSLITVNSVGSDASLTVKPDVIIDGVQARVLNSVDSGVYTNAEEAAAVQAAAYIQEEGAVVESPVLHYHRLTSAQQSSIVVTYDYNGGLDAQNWSGCQITSDAAFTPVSPVPFKDGYIFDGWKYAENNDPECLTMEATTDYAGEEISESLRLIAQWTTREIIPIEMGDKSSELIDRINNIFQVTIDVPGADGNKGHDEVILMVDGSYSLDQEWPAMVEAINAIGATVLNGSGTTQLTLMAFGMGDNMVLEHVKSVDELDAALGELPGNLLYGRSSTNCEAGFTGVENYIKNHDDTLNDVQVVYISDGNVNTDETPRAFGANWKTFSTNFGPVLVAQAAFEYAAMEGENMPAALTTVFGNRFDGLTGEALCEKAFAELTEEEFLAFADQVWVDVYAYSGLDLEAKYPVSVAERAFVKYDKEHGTFIQDVFYYSTYRSSYVTYPNRTARTIAAAEVLASMLNVEAMYLVDYDAATAWMKTGVTNAKTTFVHSAEGITGLIDAMTGALSEMARMPVNDVVVTDYMSKWVDLDTDSLRIVDVTTGVEIWNAVQGWLIDENRPTAQEIPVVVELVDNTYVAADGETVETNTNGAMYKLTWYVKDGAMLRSDNYKLIYNVTTDTEEAGFVAGVSYPANGETALAFVDENGNAKGNLIAVPEVITYFADVTINKVDENGASVAGAEFELYRINGAESDLVGTYAVDENGKVVLEDLNPGYYMLKETVVPEGYIGTDKPMYFEIVADENGNCELKQEFELEFPATAYEISNHATSVAIPQTFVVLDAAAVDGWSYSGEYQFNESDYRVVYCGDAETNVADGTRYSRTELEELFDAETANKLRAVIANSYPYVSVEAMRATGVADAENLTRGDMIAAVQLAVWYYTNEILEYTYNLTYDVNSYPQYGLTFHDYTAELPEGLPIGTTNRVVDAASDARIRALYDYLLALEPVAAEDCDVDVFFYTAVEGKEVSQSLIGAEISSYYVDGLDIYVENTRIPAPEPPVYKETEWHINFNRGQASNISFMLIDENGNVEFLEKIDIGGQTSFEIPSEPGKIPAVFVKQSTSGMFWVAEEVDEETAEAVIECLEDHNPSYKGYNAYAFGAGTFELEFKRGKFVNYTFVCVPNVYVPDTTPVAPQPEEEEVEEVVPEEELKLKVAVEGAEVTDWMIVDGVTAIYLAAHGKISDVVWTSEDVRNDTLNEICDAFGAADDAKVISGYGAHKIEYQHNKNKVKNTVYTFEAID